MSPTTGSSTILADASPSAEATALDSLEQIPNLAGFSERRKSSASNAITDASSDRHPNNSQRVLDSSGRRKKRLSDLSEGSFQQQQQPQQSSSQMSEDEASSHMFIFETKDNSAFKWQRTRGVVGALEVVSEPTFRFRNPLVPRKVTGKEQQFHDAQQAWKNLKLREDFVKSCEQLPSETCCFGLMSDPDASKRRFVRLLNEGWCKRANKKLSSGKCGLKVDIFLWNWQNASGKAESNIVLIRFFETSAYRFSRASDEGSVDFELLDNECSEISEEGDIEDQETPNVDVTAPEESRIDR